MADETMTSKMVALLDNREDLWRAFEAGCSVQGASWRLPIQDRRTMYWRLADDDRLLVYGDGEEDVTSPVPLERTFIDAVSIGGVWRPEGEEFVMILVNTYLFGRSTDVIAILWTSNERSVSPNAG